MKVFFDTNLFIYLWEEELSPRSEQTRAILRAIQKAEGVLVTSTLSLGEILVHPVRQEAAEAVRLYVERFERLELIAFDSTCSLFFADIRAHYPTVSPPDAIQLACARRADCDWFLTNDQRLSGAKIPGIRTCASYEEFQI